MAENQFRPLYYSTWYIFNFGQIFPLSETHPNVSEEFSPKVSVKDLAVYSVASCLNNGRKYIQTPGL